MREMYQQSKEQVLEHLNSGMDGLGNNEVTKAREQYGYNELVEGKKKSAFAVFLEQFTDFLVIILIVAAIISAFLGDIESTVVILFVITMNAVLGTVQHMKAEKSLNSLKQLSAPNAKVIRNGETIIVPSREVVVGDIVVLEAGDFVCSDGRIIENASMKVNESALTGESLSIEKEECVIEKEVPLGDRVNMVYSGSYVTYGRGKFVVTNTGMTTEVGKIATLLKDTSERKTPLQQNLDNFGKKLSMVILAICAVLFAISVFQGESVMNAFMFAVALAVAAIPEALSSIVTIVLAFGTNKMAKEHAIIRQLQAVEGLGSVSIICSDKTGTLTQNKMTVMKYYVGEKLYDVADDMKHQKESSKNPALSTMEQKLIDFSLLCNDASCQNGTELGDPTEVAFVHWASKYNISTKECRDTYERLDEIPFDSDRKLMSTVHHYGQDKLMITKGAVDVLLERMESIETEHGVRPFTKEDRKKIQAMNLEFSKEGLRVLAFAYKSISKEGLTLEDETQYTFLGLVAMMDPPREESKEAVAKCIEAGIRPIMITGDHKITAAAIAKQIGILKDESEAVEGAAIDSMSDEELKDFVEHVSVYARVSPEHKIRIVRAWQEKGNIVAMTGDGVNDAPALKQADVGVAMGITGSEVAKDASSMVLTDDNFATIVKAVENGRNVYENIKKAILFLLSGNTAGILAVVYASLAGLSVPFAPVHLLFINLLTDSLPAIALGLDPHSKEVMKEKPRSKDESILTKDFLSRTIVEGFVIGVLTMIGYYVGLKAGGAATASTMAFATLCLSRLVHGFNCKAKQPILFTKAMVNNKYMWGAFGIGFLLLNMVLLIPAFHPMFNVAPLSSSLIGTIYLLAFLNLIIVQTLKFIIEKFVNVKKEDKDMNQKLSW